MKARLILKNNANEKAKKMRRGVRNLRDNNPILPPVTLAGNKNKYKVKIPKNKIIVNTRKPDVSYTIFIARRTFSIIVGILQN